jgi:hypothetical protein
MTKEKTTDEKLREWCAQVLHAWERGDVPSLNPALPDPEGLIWYWGERLAAVELARAVPALETDAARWRTFCRMVDHGGWQMEMYHSGSAVNPERIAELTPIVDAEINKQLEST